MIFDLSAAVSAVFIGFYLITLPTLANCGQTRQAEESFETCSEAELNLDTIFNRSFKFPSGSKVVYSSCVYVFSINKAKEITEFQSGVSADVICVASMAIDKPFADYLNELIERNAGRIQMISFVKCTFDSSVKFESIAKCAELKYLQLRDCQMPMSMLSQLFEKLPFGVAHIDFANNFSNSDLRDNLKIYLVRPKKLSQTELENDNCNETKMQWWFCLHDEVNCRFLPVPIKHELSNLVYPGPNMKDDNSMQAIL